MQIRLKIGEEVQKRSKDLEQSNQSYKLAVEELSKAKADLTGLKQTATTQEEKVKAQGLLSVANSKIQSAKQSYEELLSEKQTAESRILALENQINNENEKIKNLTDNIEKVEKQISHITGDRENLSKSVMNL